MAGRSRGDQGELTPGELLDLQRRLESERFARIADLQRRLGELRSRQDGMTPAEILTAETAIKRAFEASEIQYRTESAAADDRLQESEKFTPLDQLETEFCWLNSGDPLAQPLEQLL